MSNLANIAKFVLAVTNESHQRTEGEVCASARDADASSEELYVISSPSLTRVGNIASGEHV